MTQKLDFRSPLGAQLARLARHELDLAEQLLSSANGNADEAVHDTRKVMKRLRALLRLVRPSLAKAEFQALDAAAAKTSRCLSGLRESKATLDCLNRLRPELLPVVHPNTLQQLTHMLEDTRLELSIEETLYDATALLAGLRAAFAKVPWAAINLGQALDGLAATYGRGRRRHRACQPSAAADVFHTLRKAVKHHTHQLHLFRGLWPAWVEAHEATAQALGDLLGLDQDRSDLQARLSDRGLGLSEKEQSAVRGVLEARSRELRLEAYPLRARVFAEPTRAWRARTGAYARAARS